MATNSFLGKKFKKLLEHQNKECYPILFYHLKKPLYYLYHIILQYLPHPKTLFLLKYYFLIFLYYFFLTVTFVFLRFSKSITTHTHTRTNTNHQTLNRATNTHNRPAIRLTNSGDMYKGVSLISDRNKNPILKKKKKKTQRHNRTQQHRTRQQKPSLTTETQNTLTSS